MKINLREFFWETFIAISIIIVAWGCATLTKQTAEEKWNCGTCECGGHYQLFDIEWSKGDEYYYYKCNKCDNVFRTTYYFKTED